MQPESELMYPSDGVNYWSTAPINRIAAQINIARFYTDNVFMFSYPHYISPQNAISGFNQTLKDYFKTGKLDNIKPTLPSFVNTKIISINANNVLSISWTEADDNYGISRVNVYKNNEFYTFRVSNRSDNLLLPSYPNSFYDDEFDLENDSAEYQLEFIDCAGNKSNKVSFVVNQGETSDTIEVENDNIESYAVYNVGDEITLHDGSEWHVIKSSTDNNPNVLILKDESIGILPFDPINYRSGATSTYCTASSYGGCNAFKAIEGTYYNYDLSGTVTKNSSLYNYLNNTYR